MEELLKANEICDRLIGANYQAYLVGGYVRDVLHGFEDISDVDVVTNANPDEIRELFKDKSYASGGTRFLVSFVDSIEVATYRVDHYDDKGNCIPERVETLKEDLARRDLTINAVAMDHITGGIIDPFDGREDLAAGIIRFVGDPHRRITDDPVRMIRACRFTARLSNNGKTAKMAPETFKAILEHKDLIKTIPKVRISKEFMKVMKNCDKPSVFITHLHLTGLLKLIIPELENCFYFSGGKHHTEYIHEHLLIACDAVSKDFPVLRIAALFHDIGKPVVYDEKTKQFLYHELEGAVLTEQIMQRMKFTSKQTKTCVSIIKLHMNTMEPEIRGKSVRKVIARCTQEGIFWEWLLLHKYADRIANARRPDYTKEEREKMYENFIYEYTREGACFAIPDLKINGNDLQELGLEGVDIGHCLNYLLKMCISRPSSNNHETLLGEAKGFNNIKQSEKASAGKPFTKPGISWKKKKKQKSSDTEDNKKC